MIAGNTRHVCRRCEAWVVSQFEILSRVVAHQDERSADHQQNDYRQRIGGLNIVAASHKSDHLALPCVGKDPAAVSLGKRGGKARAEALSKKERAEIAKKAAAARWKKEG